MASDSKYRSSAHRVTVCQARSAGFVLRGAAAGSGPHGFLLGAQDDELGSQCRPLYQLLPRVFFTQVVVIFGTL